MPGKRVNRLEALLDLQFADLRLALAILAVGIVVLGIGAVFLKASTPTMRGGAALAAGGIGAIVVSIFMQWMLWRDVEALVFLTDTSGYGRSYIGGWGLVILGVLIAVAGAGAWMRDRVRVVLLNRSGPSR